MSRLLERQNFDKITVSNLCEAAFISRATFYTYYTDKYDLLKRWLVNMVPGSIAPDDSYEKKEVAVNQFVSDNKVIIRNLLFSADLEAIDIMSDFMVTFLHLKTEKFVGGKMNPKYAVMSNFYAGGMISYLVWQARKDFPQEVKPMNPHLFELMNTLRKWEAGLS